jgi:osmotically-inducible protein OsmY
MTKNSFGLLISGHRSRPFAILLAAAFALNGCVAAVLTGAAVGGIVVVQERSAEDALEDTKINTEIATALIEKDESLFTKVDVDVVEGRVLMTGSVPSPDDRITAAKIAWNVDGVQEVLNELQVNDTSGIDDFAKDTWITTQLRAKTLGDLDINDLNYSFDTVNGVVYVLGIAQNQVELDRVTTHARNISGVKRVVSYVVIKDSSKRKSSS